MNLTDKIVNIFLNIFGKYERDSEAIIISCFFNPQNSAYRLWAFNRFYNSIKHLDHSIIECVIGNAPPQLPESANIKRVRTQNLLWHKESLLNLIVRDLPPKYKYVFWIDADVIFTNLKWLTRGVKQLQNNNIVQPFEFCVHLEKDELIPSFNPEKYKQTVSDPPRRHPKMWRSFAANFATTNFSGDTNYDRHGHVGFAWGARREVLDKVPLFDKALIGGADHIIAHAAAGQIPHPCIAKSFTENLDEVLTWSKNFYNAAQGKIGYVPGYLYHLWHGDIDKRQYLQRIRDFTPKTKNIRNRDDNGLYITDDGDDDAYITGYFAEREVSETSNYSSDVQTADSQSSSTNQSWEAFGGSSDFSGAGAGGSWDSSASESDSISGSASGNFS